MSCKIIYQKKADIKESINCFIKRVPLYEANNGLPLLVLCDGKSKAFYCECHISAKDLIALSDPDATIDPELQEEFRSNRQLEPDNIYFIQMANDALEGRQFSDLVIEFNTTYNDSRPLKILGGQHRNEAIKRALAKKSSALHGIRVYFNLSKDQRAEIMRISNTNINVSPDLRDRIDEQRLNPPNMLRDFCHKVGVLEKNEDFGDKRRHKEEFLPTVRMMRCFIVNYFQGKDYKGNIDNDAYAPYLCSSGRSPDDQYLGIFNKFNTQKSFNDTELINAGKMFAKLHTAQFNKCESFRGATKKEYKIKAFNLSVISSWAFAAGVLKRHSERLKKFYSLPDVCGDSDPLNALAMSESKHKHDPETYRGLGTRADEKERGRLLQLFLNYSESDKKRITKEMCNAAIMVFHANKARKEAQEQKEKAF
jgi:hypothetical protein